MVSNWGYYCLAVLVFCLVCHGGTVNWLSGSAVMVRCYVDVDLQHHGGAY